MKARGPLPGLDDACRHAQQQRQRLAWRLTRSQSPDWSEQEALALPRSGSLSREAIERAGFTVVVETSDTYQLRIGLWRPSWLEGADKHPPGLHALAGTCRRVRDPVQGDPVIAAPGSGGLPKYLSRGQCVAVRSALRCSPGGTLLIDLPTGAGKSRCAQALIRAHPAGLVVVAVPTTALCLDQERSLAEFEPSIQDPTAFVSGDVAARSGILQRIRAGTQRAVFASPEALTGPMSSALHGAARRGLLTALVIDEAHMVAQWGESFRPEFHWLAGLRRSLIEAGAATRPPGTILLTATVTPHCEQTLRDLFSGPGEFAAVRAGQLRGEPETWFSSCAEASDKRERVLEAVTHLPKPLILYTTRRDSNAQIEEAPWDDYGAPGIAEPDGANQWHQWLQESGFTRIGRVTGQSSRKDRREVIRAFRSGELDIVVGTSAFGLGIDHGSVRSVIHACVPENIDRYYQEIGRSGRDGLASVALCVFDSAENVAAENLAGQHLIGVVKGWDRWRRLWRARQPLGGDRFALTLNRGALANDAHRLWDDRTIILTAQAGMIELDHQPPTDAESDGRDRRVINWRVEAVHDEAAWKQRVLQARDISAQAKRAGLHALRELLSGKACGVRALTTAYRASDSGIPPTPACGGCPACRRAGLPPYASRQAGAIESPTWPAAVTITGALARRLLPEQRLFVLAPTAAWSPNSAVLPRFLTWLSESGVTAFALEHDLAENWWRRGLPRMGGFLALSERVEELPPSDSLAIVLPRGQPVEFTLLDSCRSGIILIAPEDSRQAGFPERLAKHMAPCRVEAIDTILREELVH